MDFRRTDPTLRVPGIEDLQEVAHGGFASVYRGWQPAFGRWVAVKILGAAPVDRLQQEARAVGCLSEHPHVVPVYEAGEVDGRPYLVMPYLTGGSLQDRIRRGPLRPEEVVATGEAVAGALSEAHRLGILHRDIKPANILFTAYGVPQLGDFGVARRSDATRTGGFLTATVAYAAPEVLSGGSTTARSDVYSLGATMYAALRGRAPFASREGEPPVAHAMRVVEEEPRPLQELGVPRPLAAVVERAMAKDPRERFGSAGEMGDALAGRGRSPAWGPPAGGTGSGGDHAGGRSPRRRELRPVIAAAAAAIALAGTGAAVATAVRGHAGHRQPAAAPASTTRPAITSPAPPAPKAGPPTTARTYGSSASGVLPPSAGGAGNVSEIPATVLADTLRAYYTLVDQHRLDQSWVWLAPAFQDRIGSAYYHRFWGTIRQVRVVSVEVSGGVAQITLHYVEEDGATSTESARLGFAIGAGDRILIDTDRSATG